MPALITLLPMYTSRFAARPAFTRFRPALKNTLDNYNRTPNFRQCCVLEESILQLFITDWVLAPKGCTPLVVRQAVLWDGWVGSKTSQSCSLTLAYVFCLAICPADRSCLWFELPAGRTARTSEPQTPAYFGKNFDLPCQNFSPLI